MDNEKSQRIIVRCEMTRSAKESLEVARKANGVTQVACISHILEWFGEQDRAVQSMVVGRYDPDTRKAVAKLILQKLAS